MWPYWVVFALATLPIFTASAAHARRGGAGLLPWFAIGALLTLFVGLRHEVGGDWFNYLAHFQSLRYADFGEALQYNDPAYGLLNWAAAGMGMDIYAVNLAAALVFTLGLVVFCREQPYPWLALVVAMPYVVFVIAMGYTRQGIALGLILWALAFLQQGRLYRFLAAIALAALFHKTALVMAPLGIFAGRQGWALHLLMLAGAVYGLWDMLLADEQERLWEVYVEQQMQSEGARIRAFMNVLPAALLLLYWRRWKAVAPNPWLWLTLAVAAIASALLVDLASTAVDRLALYLTPLQLAVFARLPQLMRRQLPPELVTLAVVCLYGAVAFVWLNYASHAPHWLPYRNWLFL